MLFDHWRSEAVAASTAPASLGSSISGYSWTYDTHGRAASFTAPEGTFVYGYDNTHQLTSATFTVAPGYTGGTPAGESFNFDATGNRQTTGSSVSHNRLLSDGTFNYTYDGEGNRTSRTNIATGATILYSWDHRNRLTRVEYRNTSSGPATKIVANTYDAFDRRVMKQVDDNGDGTFDRTERYVWDGGQISLVLDANGAVLHRFLHGPAIDQVFADEDSVNGLLWDLGDHQNTTRDVINNSGTVVNHVTYSPFGVNRAFSCSRCLSRLASSAFMPPY
jgi:YD repeat-containing protein